MKGNITMKKVYTFKENLEHAIIGFFASVGFGTLAGLLVVILCNVMYG